MLVAVNWPVVATWAGVGVAVLAAAFEVRAAATATQVQRVIDLHRDLTAGEVGAARLRLGAEMWRRGEGLTGNQECRAPSFEDFYPSGKAWGEYDFLGLPPDGGAPLPTADLYLVLWCFQRVEAGLRGHVLHEGMADRLFAAHAAWWDELTRNLSEDEILHLRSLRYLANRMCTPELREWAARDFPPRRAEGTTPAR